MNLRAVEATAHTANLQRVVVRRLTLRQRAGDNLAELVARTAAWRVQIIVATDADTRAPGRFVLTDKAESAGNPRRENFHRGQHVAETETGINPRTIRVSAHAKFWRQSLADLVVKKCLKIVRDGQTVRDAMLARGVNPVGVSARLDAMPGQGVGPTPEVRRRCAFIAESLHYGLREHPTSSASSCGCQ